MSRPRVLVLEHRRAVADALESVLLRGRFQVRVLSSANEILTAIARHRADAIIIDRNFPEVGAFELCRMLRNRARTANLPILMVADQASTQDRVAGLRLGVDEYIARPFNQEVVARIEALIRRRSPPPLPEEEVFAGRRIRADFARVEVQVDGVRVDLTRLEFELLRFFTRHDGLVLSREQLLQHVWGRATTGGRAVDAVVSRLRSKLGPAGVQIKTLPGRGYQFDEAATK